MKTIVLGAPVLALALLTGCPDDEPLPIGAIDGGLGGLGGQASGSGGTGGGTGGAGGGAPSDKICGGIAGIKCADGEACRYPIGQCSLSDATGTCMKVALGGACNSNYDPVCGCDGMTYINECTARVFTAAIKWMGACESTDGGPGKDGSASDSSTSGKLCAGIAGLPCGGGEYCKFGPGQCLTPDAAGTCTAKPQGCTLIYAPVCGCDGKTYASDCAAASVGASVQSTGACGGGSDGGPGKDGATSDSGSSGKFCGGIAGFPCGAAGEYCHFRDTECRTIADVGGACETKPFACTTEYAPVCGCDSKTYGNPCAAAAAGQSIASNGPCP